MFKRSWTPTLLIVLLGCEAPHQSIQAIIERQSIALQKIPAEDRANWADGLDVPLLSDKPDAEYLFWVDARRRSTIAPRRPPKPRPSC